ncbi:hypothetical protein OVY01_07555 [Robbsia sp. Bb-Pol-6]|uniref:Amidohydrolase-related domain-containing protein n=1 Tax=Robbsia betulipollinis TaxID=2981849 RepID=A0ABT3ZLE0_9BURK|nr:hypothetical protein [Robbsia betulipollinis]MCY0387090.1 hypothetical protein [Robbsia betulipollinis]
MKPASVFSSLIRGARAASPAVDQNISPPNERTPLLGEQGRTSSANSVPRRSTNEAATALRALGRNMVVRGEKEFKDGSKRPDSLVARPLRQASIFSKSSEGTRTPLPSNSFAVPHWIMSTTSSEAHTDSHMHPTNYVQRGMHLHKALEWMDELGVRNSTVMPIPTSLLAVNIDKKTDRSILSIAPEILAAPEIAPETLNQHQQEHMCGSLNHYYVPDEHKNITAADLIKHPDILKEIVAAGELYVDTSVDHMTASDIQDAGLSEAERSRFDPMMTGIHLGDPRATDGLLRTLYAHPGVFTGVGEVTITKELVQLLFAGKSQPHIHKNIEAFKDLLANLGEIGMPAVVHCDAYELLVQLQRKAGPDVDFGLASASGKGKGPAAPTQLDGLSNLFGDPRVQNTTIIWAHAGGLGRFVMEEPGHIDALQAMLDKNKNLNLDISWSRVAEQLIKSPEAIARWSDFIVKNSDRILFGSDTLAPATRDTWDATKVTYQSLFENIRQRPGGNVVMTKILNDNYDRLIVGSREKVRFFENHVLTKDFKKNALSGTDVRDTKGNLFMGVDNRPIQRITPEFLRHERALAGARLGLVAAAV